MQQIADVTGLESGAFADLLVGKVFVELESDQFAAARVKSFKAQAHEADAFEPGDLFVGQGRFIGGVDGIGRTGLIGRICISRDERNYLRGVAPMIERQVVHGAVEPAAGLADFGKLTVQFHERILDQVLGHVADADEAQGVIEQGRLEGSKELLNRFGRLRARFVWLAHRHALLHGHPASSAARSSGFPHRATAGLKVMTRESAAS